MRAASATQESFKLVCNDPTNKKKSDILKKRILEDCSAFYD